MLSCLTLSRLKASFVMMVLTIGLVFTIVLPAQAAASTSAAGSLSDFENGNMAGKSFVGQSLNEAQFANARLDAADFSKASLIGSVFSTSTLNDTIFHSANLTQAIFDQVRMNGVDLSDAILQDAMLLRAEFSDVKITGADFSDALLSPLQVKQFCKIADGINSKTGLATKDSLGCP
jgi:uncharacterized protein YjbI with pentapeptide repeats